MIEAEEIELLRQFAMDYWAALNDYDVGRVFYLFEDAYSIERDEQLRSDISRLKRFRVKLGTTHEGLPDLVGPDHGVLYVQVETPLGEA